MSEPRNFTEDFVAALLSQTSSLAILWTLEVKYWETGEVFRLVNNTEDIKVGLYTYTACGFSLRMPEEKDQGFRRGKLEVVNVDQLLTDLMRSVHGKLTVTIRVITPTDLAAVPKEFNNIEYEFLPMVVTDITYDDFKVRANLSYETISTRKFPALQFAPFHFPGLF